MMIVNTTFTARGDADPRVAELSEAAVVEGFRLAMAIDMILWFEDRGVTIDLRTGVKVALVDNAGMVEVFHATRSGFAVNHLLTPATDDEVEQTINGLFTATSDEECAPDGTLQAMVDEAERDERWYEADPIEDAYLAGTGDQAAGCYNPPRGCIEAHDAYIRGHNDAWAKAQKVTWWRRR